MENWRRHLFEQAVNIKEIQASVASDRDLSDVLSFASSSVQAPEIKKMIDQGQVIHRWATQEETDVLHAAAFIGKQRGESIIYYSYDEWYAQIANSIKYLKSAEFEFSSYDYEKNKKLVKAMAVTGFAPTVIHEYGHHTDPEHPMKHMPDAELTDLAQFNFDLDPSAGNPELRNVYSDFELDEIENYAQRREKEYVDYIFGESEEALRYILDSIRDSALKRRDFDAIQVAVISYGNYLKSLQINDNKTN